MEAWEIDRVRDLKVGVRLDDGYGHEGTVSEKNRVRITVKWDDGPVTHFGINEQLGLNMEVLD